MSVRKKKKMDIIDPINDNLLVEVVKNSLYYRKTADHVKFYDIEHNKISTIPRGSLTDDQCESMLDSVHIPKCAIVESHLTYFALYDRYGKFIRYFYPVSQDKMRKWLLEEWNKVSSDKCESSGTTSTKDMEFFKNGVRINYLKGVLFRKDCSNSYEINYYATHPHKIKKKVMLNIKRRIVDPKYYDNLRPGIIRLYQQDNHVLVNYYGSTYKPILTAVLYDIDLTKKIKYNRGILFSHEKIDKKWCYDHVNKIIIEVDNAKTSYHCILL